MTSRQGRLLAIFAIDTCSIRELDNAHDSLPNGPPRQPAFTDDERDAIWAGLESLARDGRLKLLDKVLDELAWGYPDVVSRLTAMNMRILTTRPIVVIYQRIIDKHPKLKGYILAHPRCADPYLVAAAAHHSFCVLTEEKALDERKDRRKAKGVPIPDLCSAENVQCQNLRQLAMAEGWISGP